MYSADLLKLLDLFPKVAKSSWKPYSIQYCSNLPFGFDSDGFYLLHSKNLAPDMFSLNSQEKNQPFCPHFLLWGSPAQPQPLLPTLMQLWPKKEQERIKERQ